MDLIFLICAALSIGTALGVIASRNPVFSALFLVGNLLTIAAMFAALNAHFLAVAQIIVYAGAIMVLFLFVIMLLNVKTEEPASPWLFGVGVIAAGSFGVAVLKGIGGLGKSGPLADSFTIAHGANGTVQNLGIVLYTRYLFPFEVASVLIIAAIVGAVMLSQKAKRPDASSVLSAQTPIINTGMTVAITNAGNGKGGA